MKTAIVTGATSDIGKAIVKALSLEGYHFVFLARNTKKTDAIYKGLEVQYKVFECDLSNIDQVLKTLQEIKRFVSKVDLILNVAAIWHNEVEAIAGKKFVEIPVSTVLDTINVGIVAHTLIVHQLVPLMGNDSFIVNISGTFENGAKGWLPYYISKKGLEILSSGLADELFGTGIKTFVISPSDTATKPYLKFFPQYAKACTTPENIAEQIILAIRNNTNNEILEVKKENL